MASPDKQNTGFMSLPLPGLLVITVSLFSITFYAYLNAPGALPVLPVLDTLPGDLGAYAFRFVSAALLLGLLPLATALLAGYRPKGLGLRLDWRFLASPVWWLLLLVLATGSILGAGDPALAAFYPFSKTFADLIRVRPELFLLHALLYFVLYYCAWEILFRGILVAVFLPGTKGYEALDSKREPEEFRVFFMAACIQIFPTMLLHLHHPVTETLGTIPFGLVAAGLMVRYRTILPVLFMHAFIGTSLDAYLIFGH